MPKVWIVRADHGKLAEAFVAGGYASVGWDVEIDLSGARNRTELESLYRHKHSPPPNEYRARQEFGQLDTFFNSIRADDYIVTPTLKSDVLRYGEVAPEPAFFVGGGDQSDHQPNRRRVNWAHSHLLRSELSVPFQNSLKGQLTVFSLERHRAEFFEKIGAPTLEAPGANATVSRLKPYDLAIERILRLSPSEFEELVGHLLRAMGFEIEVTQPVADGGVDFRGVLNVSNAAQVSITGQVKRYQTSSKISARPIRDLRGRIPIGSQGTFVTTSDYTKDARRVAEEDGFARVGLINGEQLIDLLTQHWQDIPDEFQDALGLKPILVPA